jgi:hypothetical protein
VLNLGARILAPASQERLSYHFWHLAVITAENRGDEGSCVINPDADACKK